jgi:hypothetical protein
MAQDLHSALTTGELHECKGIDEAAAGDVKSADGQGAASYGDIDYRACPTGWLVQASATKTSTHSSGTDSFAFGTGIPKITDGVAVMTHAHTPLATSHILIIIATVLATHAADSNTSTFALFKVGTTNALAATALTHHDAWTINQKLCHTMVAGTTSEITFQTRIGPDDSSTTYINGESVARYNGVAGTGIVVLEFKA